MTEKERQDLKQMLDLGMIDQKAYDQMAGGAPPSASEAAEWMVQVDGQFQGRGPYTKADLRGMIARGELTRQSMVMQQGMFGFSAIELQPDLQDIL